MINDSVNKSSGDSNRAVFERSLMLIIEKIKLINESLILGDHDVDALKDSYVTLKIINELINNH